MLKTFSKKEVQYGKKLHNFMCMYLELEGFPGGSDGKEFACNAGDLHLIPGLGSSPGEGSGTHSSVPAWRIPWTGEPGRLQFRG